MFTNCVLQIDIHPSSYKLDFKQSWDDMRKETSQKGFRISEFQVNDRWKKKIKISFTFIYFLKKQGIP